MLLNKVISLLFKIIFYIVGIIQHKTDIKINMEHII